MPSRPKRILVLTSSVFAATLAAAQKPSATPISLPGGEGGIGFDDLQFARALGKVLVPAGRTGNLDLVDPSTHAVTAIGGFSSAARFGGGHGDGTTSADEGGGYLFAVDRTTGTVVVVDPAVRKIVGSAKLASEPDYVRYVAATRELWVTEPEADQIETFRLEGDKPPKPVPLDTIEIKGGPESLVVDSRRGRAYTHLWQGTTLAIDVKSHAVAERWPNGCGGSRGIALDEMRGFLFVGCTEGKAVVLDAAHGGKRLGEATSGSGVDFIDYDPKLSHLYFPGAKSQTMAILGVSPNGGLTVLGTFPTAASSHCVVSDRNGTAYVCDPKMGRLLVIRDPYPATTK